MWVCLGQSLITFKITGTKNLLLTAFFLSWKKLCSVWWFELARQESNGSHSVKHIWLHTLKLHVYYFIVVSGSFSLYSKIKWPIKMGLSDSAPMFGVHDTRLPRVGVISWNWGTSFQRAELHHHHKLLLFEEGLGKGWTTWCIKKPNPNRSPVLQCRCSLHWIQCRNRGFWRPPQGGNCYLSPW